MINELNPNLSLQLYIDVIKNSIIEWGKIEWKL